MIAALIAGIMGMAGPMIAALIIGIVGVAGAFAFNAATFLPLLIALVIAIPNIPAPQRTKAGSVRHDIRDGLKFVWTHPGTRRLTMMGLIFMFLAAPLQGLLPVFLFLREPAIDKLQRRRRERLGVLGAIWEAITARSHRPAYPAESDVPGAAAEAER
jgi:hypothetical protein